MKKIIFIFIFIFFNEAFLAYAFATKAYANSSSSENFSVTIPSDALINLFSDNTPAVGFVDESLDSVPVDSHGYVVGSGNSIFKSSGGFVRLVEGSYNGTNWELTTLRPIGLVASYNSSGNISATFVSITGNSVITPRIYPSIIVFGVSSGAGVMGRLFKFYPIVKVDNTTKNGTYSGKITFTVTHI